MKGINRALADDMSNITEESSRFFSNINKSDVPCFFISYQRNDEDYASEVASYITSKQMDVYFDLNDTDLKFKNQINHPEAVTDAIKVGLNKTDHMIVIVSPTTYLSQWVPFEVGYAYENKGDKMTILRHKGISKSSLPAYLKVKEVLQGSASLNAYLDSIRKQNYLYENLKGKGVKVMAFSEYSSNPLNKYLDNE